MRHPLSFTFLGFHFNSLIDEGHCLELNATHEMLKKEKLFTWIKDKFGSSLDLSLFSQEDLRKIEAFFSSMSNAVDAGRKFGVRKNGLCLLVAYCFEAAQREEKVI